MKTDLRLQMEEANVQYHLKEDHPLHLMEDDLQYQMEDLVLHRLMEDHALLRHQMEDHGHNHHLMEDQVIMIRRFGQNEQ